MENWFKRGDGRPGIESRSKQKTNEMKGDFLGLFFKLFLIICHLILGSHFRMDICIELTKGAFYLLNVVDQLCHIECIFWFGRQGYEFCMPHSLFCGMKGIGLYNYPIVKCYELVLECELTV